MKILLFGGAGQLGFDLIKRGIDLNFEMISPVQSEVDITNFEEVKAFSQRIKPKLIINSAAYTAVDKAETERENAFLINRDGARNVAKAAALIGARVLYLSTDYVFNGELDRSITEADKPCPINVYGESKLAGEEATLEEAKNLALIVRTSSLFGKRGVNFVATMIKLFQTQPVVKVVNDQFMCPTWSGWLAEALLDLARIEVSGIVNATCSGVTSWYDFAASIHESILPYIKDAERCSIQPITTEEFARPAKRPRYSALDCSKLQKLLGRPSMTWQQALSSYLVDTEIIKND